MITFSEYQQEAFQTAIYPNAGDGYWIYPLLGLVGETGELSEKLKKNIRDHNGHLGDTDRELLKKEVGDILWYLSALARELGFDFGEIAQQNIDKIRDRQSRGTLRGNGDVR